MKTAQKSPPRHFPYQHPRFSFRKNAKDKEPWKKSLYYWWWAYLRHNSDYIVCCNNSGSGSMAEIYADFGDVRDSDFEMWWKTDNRGAELFAEPFEEEAVRMMNPGDPMPDGINQQAIVFPTKFPKKYILKQCQLLLTQWHARKRGEVLARNSQAKHQFSGQPNINALALTLLVYETRLANPDMKLWEIGNYIAHLNLHTITLPSSFAKHKISPSMRKNEIVDHKNLLATNTSRYIKVAKTKITATGKGHFPK